MLCSTLIFVPQYHNSSYATCKITNTTHAFCSLHLRHFQSVLATDYNRTHSTKKVTTATRSARAPD